MKQPTKALTRLATACVTALLLTAAPAQAQDKPVMFRFSSWVPAQHALNPALIAWGESLKKASGGTLSATMFPAQQLGKAFDHYDMARDGIADFAYVNPGYQPGRFPIFAGASLPFLMSNGKGGSAAVDAWYRQYVAREMKDVKFCFAFVHDPGAFHTSKKKIVSPSDIKGMNIRSATDTVGQMIVMLGGNNIQSSAPEVREIIERGVADGVTFPWGSILLFGIDKATKYHMDLPLYVTPFVWVMNQTKYNSLSTAQKKAVDDHCTTEWAEKVASNWADYENDGRAKLGAMPNHEVYKLTPPQVESWRSAVAPLEAQWGKQVNEKTGLDPKAVLDGLKQQLAKHKAAL